MSTEKLAKLQSFSQGEVTFERLKQILATELSYSEYEELIVLSQYQLEQQKALARAINQIRGLLDIDAIFQTTTKEVCQLLEADRVAVYRFTPNWDGHFVAEVRTLRGGDETIDRFGDQRLDAGIIIGPAIG